jgi:glycosyltransferase involved in cell wall biosynthesis
MKVLIISRYPPFPGGRENFVFELAHQLLKNNTVLVITPDQEDSDEKNLIIRKYPETKDLLKNIIEKFNPDVINSHTFYLSKDAFDIAKEKNISFGITLHGDQFSIGNQQRQNIVKEAVLMSDFVINVSENGRESAIRNIEGVKQEKLFVINNGVNLKTFHKNLKQLNLSSRKGLDINPSKKIILVPTRIVVYKGLNFLLHSIVGNRVFIEENNILFLISIPDYEFSKQEADLFDELEVKIMKNNIYNLIQFIFLKYEDMNKAYSVADMFLLPSEKEQLPISILESMACQIPIIATRVGGIPELLKDGRDAYTVNYGDDIALINSIKKYLDIKNCVENSKSAFEKVCNKYSIENITKKYESLYRVFKKI